MLSQRLVIQLLKVLVGIIQRFPVLSWNVARSGPMLLIGNHIIGKRYGELGVHERLLQGKDPGPPAGLILVLDEALLYLRELDQLIEATFFI